MTDTSVDLDQLKDLAKQIRAVADEGVAGLIAAQGKVPSAYQDAAAAGTAGGMSGIFEETKAGLESGFRDTMKKCRALQERLLALAANIEGHVRGVRNDEADASKTFTGAGG